MGFGVSRLLFQIDQFNPPNTIFINEFLSDPLPADMKRLKLESEKEFNNTLVKFDNGRYFEMTVWGGGDDPNAEYGRVKMEKILDWFIANSK